MYCIQNHSITAILVLCKMIFKNTSTVSRGGEAFYAKLLFSFKLLLSCSFIASSAADSTLLRPLQTYNSEYFTYYDNKLLLKV